jgi:hypothetical protein
LTANGHRCFIVVELFDTREALMTDDVSVALLEYLRKVGLGLEPDFLREAIRGLSEALMELDVSQQTGAALLDWRQTQHLATLPRYNRRANIVQRPLAGRVHCGAPIATRLDRSLL